MSKIYYIGDWAVQMGPVPVICNWSGSTDPMVAVGQFGKGRTLAYTSNPAPHWGCNFVFRDQYARFWNAMQDWLTGKLDR